MAQNSNQDESYNAMLQQLMQRRQSEATEASRVAAPNLVTSGTVISSDANRQQAPSGLAAGLGAPVARIAPAASDVVDLTGDDERQQNSPPVMQQTMAAQQPQPAYRLPAALPPDAAVGQYLAAQNPQQQPGNQTSVAQAVMSSIRNMADNPYAATLLNALMYGGAQAAGINVAAPTSNLSNNQNRVITSGVNPNPYFSGHPLPNQGASHPLGLGGFGMNMLGNGLRNGPFGGITSLYPASYTGPSISRQSGAPDNSNRNTAVQPTPAYAKAALDAVLAGMQSAGKDDEREPPQGLMSVSLLRHQRLALHWMCKRESGSSLPIGGILADDQGLGKTVTTIALILSEPEQQTLSNMKLSKDSTPTRPSSRMKLEPSPVVPNPTTTTDNNSDGVKAEASSGLLLGGDASSDDIVEIQDDATGSELSDEDDVIELDLTEQERALARLGPVSSSGMAQAGTLVVCPATVLYQWEQEIKDKTSRLSGITVYIYHGKSKGITTETLARFSVILTTYQTLTQEMPESARPDRKKSGANNSASTAAANKTNPAKDDDSKKRKRGADKGGPLYSVMWHRVVLDECQVIKNPRTISAHAAWSLRAKRRWCLSGTPLQNSVDDLYPLFRFLKYEPYSKASAFKELIRDPINGANPDVGYKRLRAVLGTIMLRRTKGSKIDGEPVVKLPERLVRLEQKDFNEEEREFYKKLEAEFSQKVKKFQAEGTMRQNYVSMLWMLLRLRQACNHPWLVRDGKTGSGSGQHQLSAGEITAAKKLPAATQLSLTATLEERLTECVVCNDVPEDPVVSICSHIYCRQCVSSQVSLAGHGAAEAELAYHCPECRRTLGRHDFFGLEALHAAKKGGASTSTNGVKKQAKGALNRPDWQSSAKVDALMALLDDLRSKGITTAATPSKSVARSVSLSRLAESLAKNKGVSTKNGASSSRPAVPVPTMEKVIVFSQWTSMLDLVEIPLKKSKYEFRRLDGSMTIPARQAAIRDFSTCPEVTVMLVSLKAASLGVNLVSANHVVLLDLWYNPTVEEQAIDRAHRMGQNKAVHVTRLTIKDSIEDRIISLQDKKRQMVDSAVGDGGISGNLGARLTMDDLKYLFTG